ncbi:HD-GYP domain-containing protein [Novosphingobium sp. SG751A]|uniref:HD-GYP domain-containing protein n=1 Tax=Novosphingobium sp. SG751A TaxID=2587000 RepID=UPI002111C7F4|nr:HD-GYP domain-containing protein [Novosphingobium sp. SG751A]
MLKRIDPHKAQLGMFIHKLEGNWFSHPFWRGRFLLTDEDRLARLRASDVAAVIIDTERGCDVEDGEPVAFMAPLTPRRRRQMLLEEQKAAQRQPNALTSRSMAREFGRAEQVADMGAKVISRAFIEARLGKAIQPEVVAPVVEAVFASVQRYPYAFNGLMRCKRDMEYLFRHALATTALMISLGRQMKLSHEQMHDAGLVGLLMDSGIALLPVPDGWQGDWRDLPERAVREHVLFGRDFVATGGFDEAVVRACYEHHERMDGAGYPEGAPGEGISLLGRMAAICDAYDDLANPFDGESVSDPAYVIEKMQGDAGAFDPDILREFIVAVGVYPVGSIVLLASHRLAMVVDQNPDDPASPTVRCFHSLKLGRAVAQETVDLSNCYGKDRIVGAADSALLAQANLPNLGQMRMKLLAAACAG